MTTVFDLLRKSELGLSVIAGSRAALDREISRPYITDLPSPGRYLSERTLVITSGLWARDEERVSRFVDDLVESDAVGLVVGLVEIEVVPDAVIAQCRENEIPLLVVEDDIDFSRIAEAVDGSDSAVPMLERGVEFSRRLLATAAQQPESDDVLRAFSDEFGVDCWFLDGAGLRVWASAEAPPPHVLARVWDRARLSGRREEVWEIAPGRFVSLFVLGAVDAGEGGIFVCDADARTWPRGLSIAVQSAVAALRIIAARSALPLAGVHQRRDGLVEDLADGSDPEIELATRLRMEGVDVDAPTIVATATAELPDATVRGIIAAGLAALDPVIGVRGGVVTVLLGNMPAIDPTLLEAFRSCGDHAGELLGGTALRIGISDVVHGATDVGRAIALAEERMRGATGAGRVLVGYDGRAHTHRALLTGVGESARQTFATALLGPILRYDDRHSSDMLVTLAAFLDHNGGWQSAAEALHIHPNTLRYRIGRIGELTGRDLSLMSERVDLYLALACQDPDLFRPVT